MTSSNVSVGPIGVKKISTTIFRLVMLALTTAGQISLSWESAFSSSKILVKANILMIGRCCGMTEGIYVSFDLAR
jgi:hypothetical protein